MGPLVPDDAMVEPAQHESVTNHHHDDDDQHNNYLKYSHNSYSIYLKTIYCLSKVISPKVILGGGSCVDPVDLVWIHTTVTQQGFLIYII